MDELFAIAQAMEQEAAARYTQLATRVRAEGNGALADLFERLAEEERGHEGAVSNWSRRQAGKLPDPNAIRWELPETFDQETAAELASSRLINAYRVLSMAVRNEERAFALWSYIAAQAEDAEVQRAAERMALEELEHVSLLRRARRTAYHAERRDRDAPQPLSIRELLCLAADLEAGLSSQLEQRVAGLSGSEADRITELAQDTREIAAYVGALCERPEASAFPRREEADPAAGMERLVEIYLDIADRSREEQLVASAQDLARQAIMRLTLLRDGWNDVRSAKPK